MKVDIRELPEYHVAYIRHVGAYSGIFQAFQKLKNWAGEEGLLGSERMMAIYWDDPNVVAEDKLRSDACIPVAKGQSVSGEIQTQTMPKGLFGVYHCEIQDGNFNKPWIDAINYLNNTEYEAIDEAGYEIYYESENMQKSESDEVCVPAEKWVVDICVPVKKRV